MNLDREVREAKYYLVINVVVTCMNIALCIGCFATFKFPLLVLIILTASTICAASATYRVLKILKRVRALKHEVDQSQEAGQ